MISLWTSITARRDSRKVDGNTSESLPCSVSSVSVPFGVFFDQSGKFAMIMEFVAMKAVTICVTKLML
jgi:hypothetical protein